MIPGVLVLDTQGGSLSPLSFLLVVISAFVYENLFLNIIIIMFRKEAIVHDPPPSEPF